MIELGLLDLVITKSKDIKDIMETKAISRGYVNKFVVDDPHFILCFTGMLDRSHKNGEVAGDLKNLTKLTFQKFESFVLTKIEARVRLDNIDHALEEHYKKAEVLTKKRITDLSRLLKE